MEQLNKLKLENKAKSLSIIPELAGLLLKRAVDLGLFDERVKKVAEQINAGMDSVEAKNPNMFNSEQQFKGADTKPEEEDKQVEAKTQAETTIEYRQKLMDIKSTCEAKLQELDKIEGKPEGE
jgi:division protein CdvB (Snf7/Vps24/ESCRT-III family)